jgi:hypothetical protein
MYEAIINFEYEPEKDWNGYKKYNPPKTMEVFNKVFLKLG